MGLAMNSFWTRPWRRFLEHVLQLMFGCVCVFWERTWCTLALVSVHIRAQ
jgi:hypothetical protein